MQNISLNDIDLWQAEKRDFQLIDVRESIENELFNIGGVLMPLSEIMQHKEAIEINKPVVFYCQRGIRSQIAIQRLQRHFPDADFYNLQDGIIQLMKMK
jgi:adenylyltransferase/sulfurtransferase